MKGREVLQVATGITHTVCVTEGGAVFAFGNNSYGQPGFGDTVNRLVPTLLRGELANKAVVQVAAACCHTLFLTEDGLVFVCGENENGQLDVCDTEDRLRTAPPARYCHPQLIVCDTVYLAAGGNHTLCITADGLLFACGKNSRGQLPSTGKGRCAASHRSACSSRK